MGIVIKAIKPKQFNDAVILDELIAEAFDVAGEMLDDYHKTVATWTNPPGFIMAVRPSPTQIATEVSTDNEIYRYVDKGTKPHEIWAGIYTGKSDKKVLRFQGTYTAKTVPGVIGSRAGGSSGEYVHTPYVQHPGTKPRHFSRTIERKWKKLYRERMNKALARGVKRSGHKA